MIVLAWLAIIAVALFAGSSFWAVARSPSHLYHLFRDLKELSRVMEFFGPTTLLDEAQRIEPVLGSYAKNIETWDYAHSVSLRKPRNVLLVLSAANIGAAYLVSPWCLLTTVAALVFPALFPLQDSAKNNNVNHVHTIVINLIKWHQTDPPGCRHYCTTERPDFSTLHSLIVAMVNSSR